MDGETVNICGLCLSQPRTRRVLEYGGWKMTRVIDAASRHVQGVDMELSRVSTIGSALADLTASRWLEPTGMAAGVQANGSVSHTEQQGVRAPKLGHGRDASGQPEGTARPGCGPFPPQTSRWLLRGAWLGRAMRDPK